MADEDFNFIHDKYGYCHYTIGGNFAPLIYNLFVDPQYRRQGNATRLLQYVIAELRRLGFDGPIYVEARPREDSISIADLTAFYAKFELTILPQ